LQKVFRKDCNLSHIMCNSSFLKSFCKISYRQSVSVCASDDGKSLRLKNASLPYDGRCSQAKADDVTHSCAFNSRWVEESSKACLSPSARAIFTHTCISASTYCLAHRDALSICVTSHARRKPRGCQCFLGVDLKGKNIFDPSAEFSIVALYSTFTNLR